MLSTDLVMNSGMLAPSFEGEQALFRALRPSRGVTDQ